MLPNRSRYPSGVLLHAVTTSRTYFVERGFGCGQLDAISLLTWFQLYFLFWSIFSLVWFLALRHVTFLHQPLSDNQESEHRCPPHTHTRQLPSMRTDSPGFLPEPLWLFASHIGKKAAPYRLWPVCCDMELAAGCREHSHFSIQAH